MATSDDSRVFSAGGLQWTSQSVVFHRNTGKSIKLLEKSTVATRVSGWEGPVFTSEPVSIGQMLRVTVLERETIWASGVRIGFTKENLESTTMTRSHPSAWERGEREHSLILFANNDILYNGKKLCDIDLDVANLTKDQSVGVLLTKERALHWFVDGKWRGVVHVDGYPVDEPMWGAVNVYGRCSKVRAEVLSVSGYHSSSERQLVRMGLVSPQAVNREEWESLRQQVQRKDEEIQEKHHENQQLQQQLASSQQLLTTSQQRLASSQQQLTASQQQLREAQQQLARANELRQRSDGENQQLIATLRQQNDVLQRRVSSLSVANRSQNSQEVEFWQVSPEEVVIKDDQVLGGGAWGYVAKGTFRGTAVAVKRVYPAILQMSTVERIRREIRTMAQIRHPNLVLFIAAVLNERTGPMIVIELLDTSLRSAYQANRIGANKRKIFRDVSSALTYLHAHREPIIHRDVSSANVLLVSQPNDTWLAKLSDFGSANLARYATTLGEGAIVYTAPEAYPHPPTSPTPRPPQTIKIDVYSFGVVACEVVTSVFPETHRLGELLERVGHEWPEIHPLITSCVSHSPQSRPSMETVLSQIKQMDWEP